MINISGRFVALLIFTMFGILYSETLFEVKDASNNKVLDVSTDGLRVLNQGDTVMVISSNAVKVNLDNSKDKALSRTFSVTTATSKKSMTNVLEVGTQSTTMREGTAGDQYTHFSPENLFIGLNAGSLTDPNGTWRGMNNIFLGNSSGYWNDWGSDNIFIGDSTGFNSKNTDKNIFIGNLAGFNTESDDPGYGSDNIFIGVQSGFTNLEGQNNVYIGTQAGELNVNGIGNVFVGSLAGRENTSSDNAFIGGVAGYHSTSGNKNTFIGAYSGYNNGAGLRNVFLGYKAGFNEAGSDRLYIDNSDTSTPLIWGDFDNDLLRFNGNVGINASASASYGLYVSDDYYAIQGNATTSTGTYTYGVYGDGNGGTTRNVSIYGASPSGSGTNWAGYFNGDVNVIGNVVKGGDTVKVDHPLDPDNKILSHSGVISDEMTTVYNGNVILNNSGSASVKLPDWFESMNEDFKYQLTSVGAPGPNLYISKEIEANQFEISGGEKGMKVSWQITAVRKDNYAKENPIQVVSEKTSEAKGFYIHPKAFGLPEERSIEYQIQKRQEGESEK